MSLLATLFTVVLASAGFALLVQASPLGKVRSKPFSCQTCLSGWGAIVAGALLTYCPDAPLAAVAVLALAGTGGAHALFAGSSRGQPPSGVLGEAPPPPPRAED